MVRLSLRRLLTSASVIEKFHDIQSFCRRDFVILLFVVGCWLFVAGCLLFVVEYPVMTLLYGMS
jgi:hypothetical protein